MPLETTGAGQAILAALFPPGNVAAEINRYRQRLYRALDLPGVFTFPCAAPLACLRDYPGQGELEELAGRAWGTYHGLKAYGGILFLPPVPTEEESLPRGSVYEGPPSGRDASGQRGEEAAIEGVPADFPIPCGRGFPLGVCPKALEAGHPDWGLPAPPRLSFRTFQVAVIRIHWSDPWYYGMTWETLDSLRFPLRILRAP